MVLIYSHTGSARLLYICTFIFKEQLGIPFQLTIDSEKFRAHTGPKINYSHLKFSAGEFHIENHNLLFEQHIKPQAVDCFTENNYTAFFKTANSDFSFDIFAASFYLITRYEEYLPHEKDMYGRYHHENSLAYRKGFLNIPLINCWVQELAVVLQEKFPAMNMKQPVFSFQPTYDIDIAYSYKYKGLARNTGGFLKAPSLERIKVLAGGAKDPFDCYDWLKDLHEKYRLQAIYFFLLAEKNGPYDKNILPYKDAMWKLVRKHANKFTVGLHPSWQSGDDKLLLKKEKAQLLDMTDGTKMFSPSGNIRVVSRQHYIRFNLPEGYQKLIQAGITDDYSMGYGSINGFRASVASSFYWYDLEKEANTVLRVHPFCFMDANSFYEQRQDPGQTFEELMHYLAVCKQVNGTLISIWHNHILGTAADFSGWKEIYEKFIAQVQQ
jgi:hypothetical protein